MGHDRTHLLKVKNSPVKGRFVSSYPGIFHVDLLTDHFSSGLSKRVKHESSLIFRKVEGFGSLHTLTEGKELIEVVSQDLV